ncbi:helix-turn-helix domain-containing protein [Lentzea rhizosphaerae]|uniref:Helix-turn-helix domain-containing protein n=1 Tax=Lentzea rhizosphaerae TaxID=2041025 RepID=A0ABV8C2E5_9PSEU
MPRAERPLDDDQTELGRFAADLRRLRDKAGKPSYRELASRAHYSAASLSDAAGGRRLPTLAVTLAYVTACGGDPEEWKERWHAIAAPPGETSQAPYVGLKSFQREDADRFFGREKLTAKLLDLSKKRAFVVVVGASGSGKSSLLRAGLAPRVKNALVFTPGVQPIDECAVRLGQLTGESAVKLVAELADPRALGLRIRQLDEDLVLVIDQFEELFTLAGAAQRDWFIKALLSAPHVVIGVRADFYGHLSRHPELVEAIEGAQVLVGPMTPDELRRAITEPAQRAGATVETALVARLVADVAGQAAALPLVQHALVETWHRRRGMTLSLAGYEEAGGVEHALARTAEAVFGDLSDLQQTAAKQIFLRLIALGEGTEDTKRRAALRHLDPDVLERLAGARLVTLSEQYVELTHEALIRSWPRLRDWVAEDRNALNVHHRLTEAAAAWDGHDPDQLYRGARLADAAALDRDALTPDERAFVDAGVAAEQDRQRAERRRTWRGRAAVVMLNVLMLLMSGTFFIARLSSEEATWQRDGLDALKAANEATTLSVSDPQLALRVGLAAFRLGSYDESVRDQVRDVLLTTYALAGAIRSTDPADKTKDFLAVSPYGKLALSGDRLDGTALWAVSGDTASQVSVLPHIRYAMFSGDERTLVHVGAANTEVRDVSDPSAPRLVSTLPLPLGPTSVSNDGRMLVGVKLERAGDGEPFELDGEPSLWRLTDSGPPVMVPLPCRTTSAPTLRPDGQMLAAVCVDASRREALRIWRIEPDGLHEVFVRFVDPGVTVKYSPTGRFLSVRMPVNPRIEVWDVTDPSAPRTWTEFQEARPGQTKLVFGNADTVVAVLTTDGVVLWDIRFSGAGSRLATFRGFDAFHAELHHRPDHNDFVGAMTPADRQLLRFPVDIDRTAKTLCARGNVTLTDEEWDRYLHGVERVPVC